MPRTDLAHAASIKLTRLVPADLDVVAAIEKDSFGDPWSRREFESLLKLPQTIFLVARAEAEHEILGYVVALAVVDDAEILNVAVRSEDRGKGLGGLLLDGALDEAERRGAASVFLEVRITNTAARALYLSRGFVEIGRRKGYYRSPVEDALVLRRARNR